MAVARDCIAVVFAAEENGILVVVLAVEANCIVFGGEESNIAAVAAAGEDSFSGRNKVQVQVLRRRRSNDVDSAS